MSLPIFQTILKDLSLMQTKWASIINPILAAPIVNGLLLNNVSLVSGDNTINHRLGRKLQGWIVVGKNANANIYDKQSTNTMPELTLVLNSSGTLTVNLWVF